MRKSRFSEAQLIGILKEAEVGGTAADVCRRHGISQPTFHRRTDEAQEPEARGWRLGFARWSTGARRVLRVREPFDSIPRAVVLASAHALDRGKASEYRSGLVRSVLAAAPC